MAYENTAAEFRPELQVKVEEAMGIDNKFIADFIFPVFPVETRKGFYKRIKRGKGQLLTNPGKNTPGDPLLRAPGTAYREISRTSEQDSWLCKDRGLEESMDDVIKQEESRFFDLESSTSIWLMRNMRIAREARVAAQLMDPAVWGAPIVSDTAFTIANLDTFDFPTLMKEAIRTIDKRQETPNTWVVSKELYDLITSSTLLRQFFFGTAGGSAMITKEMIAEKFELEQILVGRASYDTTKPGKDSSDENLVWTWGDDMFWIGQCTGGAPEMGGAGRTMVLEELTGGQLFVTETYRKEEIRSDRLRVRQDDDTKVINENSGVLVQVNGM